MRGLTLVERARFRLAGSAAKREAWKTAGLMAGVIVAYAVAGTLDYQDQLLAEKMAAEERFAAQQAAMLACLNGGSPGYYRMTEAGHRVYLVCDVHEVSDENVKGKRS